VEAKGGSIIETLYAQAEYGKVVLKRKALAAPDKNQLLLEAVYSALSPGTERDLMSGKVVPLPQAIGYAMIARVVETGADVTGFKAGDIVACTGEHAEYLVLSEDAATPVPVGTDLEQAAFFNLAHTALYGIRRTKIQLGESVLVLGQGMIGLLTAGLARQAGACPVIVTARDDERLKLSKQLGAHITVNVREHQDELERTLKGLGSGGPAIVFEAAGSPETMTQSLALVGERGRVMILSTVHDDTGNSMEFNEMMRGLFMKGATLIGSYVNSKPFYLKRRDIVFNEKWPPGLSDRETRFTSSDIWTSDEDIRTVMNLIYYGSLDLRPLITHRFSVEQIPEAYEMVWKKDRSLIGGLICWKQEG